MKSYSAELRTWEHLAMDKLKELQEGEVAEDDIATLLVFEPTVKVGQVCWGLPFICLH